MSGHFEEKITKFLSFPYDNFLMVRFEFVQILGDELEAKVLRVIEKTVEAERKRIYRDTLNQRSIKVLESPLDITRDVWVPISYKMFMNDLYGTVSSETTIKKALKSLLDKRIIFRRHRQHTRYDAPEYKVHVSLLQMLLGVLGTAGGQKLISSIFETISQLPPQELTPSECQKLIPSQAGRGAKIDTTYNNSNKSNNNKENPSHDTPSSTSDAAHADIAAPALNFSSLLASVATLSDEQKQQLQDALLGQSSVQSSEALPTAPPLPQAERETVQVAEHQREALLVQPSAQPSEAPPIAPLLPQAEGETVQVAEQPRHEDPAPPSETRSKPPKDTSLAERIEAVFRCLDKLAQQTTGDPDFIWTRSERAKRSVKQLLADGRVVTPEKLSAVYLHMATMKPDPKTGFTWANKLSIANVCNNYDSIWLEIVKAKQLKDAASSPGAAPALQTLVIFGTTDHGLSSQPLPVAPLRRDLPPRRLLGKGV